MINIKVVSHEGDPLTIAKLVPAKLIEFLKVVILKGFKLGLFAVGKDDNMNKLLSISCRPI